VPASHDADAALEIALIGLVLRDVPTAASQRQAPPATQHIARAVVTPAPTITKQEPLQTTTVQKQEPVSQPAIIVPEGPTTGVIDEDTWQRVLTAIKKQYNTLHGVARMAKPQFNGEQVILNFAFPFHQKRLNEPKNKQILLDTIKAISGLDVMLTCVVNKDTQAPVATTDAPVSFAAIATETVVAPTAAAPSIDTISNIFGGAEVIES
jgi:hypothetical protein